MFLLYTLLRPIGSGSLEKISLETFCFFPRGEIMQRRKSSPNVYGRVFWYPSLTLGNAKVIDAKWLSRSRCSRCITITLHWSRNRKIAGDLPIAVDRSSIARKTIDWDWSISCDFEIVQLVFLKSTQEITADNNDVRWKQRRVFINPPCLMSNSSSRIIEA